MLGDKVKETNGRRSRKQGQQVNVLEDADKDIGGLSNALCAVRST